MNTGTWNIFVCICSFFDFYKLSNFDVWIGYCSLICSVDFTVLIGMTNAKVCQIFQIWKWEMKHQVLLSFSSLLSCVTGYSVLAWRLSPLQQRTCGAGFLAAQCHSCCPAVLKHVRKMKKSTHRSVILIFRLIHLMLDEYHVKMLLVSPSYCWPVLTASRNSYVLDTT